MGNPARLSNGRVSVTRWVKWKAGITQKSESRYQNAERQTRRGIPTAKTQDAKCADAQTIDD
jgi:hypothetical protein